MSDESRDKGESEVDPTPDDIADTLSASFRTMREMSDKFDAVIGTFLVLEIAIAIFCGIASFYLLRKVIES